ncbi:GNAT family N-acetyltransferase [Heyndrickxia sp. FSL W8-0496]|uniref:GNAT family N-acetyltransferase n=1 Tax=Heyndrickxia TaxID=2837504 RepID=UPI0030FCF9B8
MSNNVNVIEKYKYVLDKKGIDLILLEKSEKDIERLEQLFIQLDSIFLIPQQQNMPLKIYVEKLINQAFNFVLVESNCDIGLISIYANDFVSKTSFVNAIGILTSHQGKQLASITSEFIIEYSKGVGMEYMKAHINKANYKSLSLVKKFGFKVLSEETDKFIVIKDLKEIDLHSFVRSESHHV